MPTTTYVPSDADRAPLPASYRNEPRYLGYRDTDAARPFAKYFCEKTDPIQSHVRDALLGGMAPPEHGYLLYHCASEMNHLATFLPALYEEFRCTP